MKSLKYFSIPLLAAAILYIFTGCDDKGSSLSKAVLASSSYLSFDVNGGTQAITIYADADWVTDCPDWISVSPDYGTGTTEVNVTVGSNTTGGVENLPRQDDIIFHGSTLASQATVTVYQEGDKYRDVTTYTLDQISSLADETPVSVPDVIVAVLGTSGFMVTDSGNSNYVFVSSSVSFKVGDKISIMGEKASTYGLPEIVMDTYEAVSSGESVTLPTPTDITDLIDTYTSTKWEYVSVTGRLNSNVITIEGATFNVNVVETPESVGLSALDIHKVALTGFYAGLAAPYVRILGVEVQDLGMDGAHYYEEDFSWTNYYAEMYGAEDNISTGVSTSSAPNIYQDCPEAQAAFDERGYAFVCNPSGHAHYLQPGCVKFGRKSYQGGIILPLMDAIPEEGADCILTFNWTPMRGGTYVYDKLGVEVLVGDDVVWSYDSTYHNKEDGETGPLEWISETVRLENYKSTEFTRITIRSTPWETADSNYQRWFIDDICIDPAED